MVLNILRLVLLLCAQLWLAKIGKGAADVGDVGFCKEFAHLSMCQLRQQLGQLEQLLDSAIGEIDFLADGGQSADAESSQSSSGAIKEVETGDDALPSSMQKRATTRSLAGAPLLVRLASRGGSGAQQSAKNAATKILRAGNAGILIGGGQLRQSSSGQRASTYRLIRLPAGARSPLMNAAGVAAGTGIGGGASQGQMKAANQLLRQLWA